jgi:hypothetical protein
MGYPTISQFDVNFIQRTRENLKCEVTNRYTHLMNSLLGLIVLPRQYFEQGKTNKDFYKLRVLQTPELNFLKGKTTYNDEFGSNIEISKLVDQHRPVDELTIGALMQRLRNCIAHQSIRPTSENGEWKGMIFRNYSTEKRAAAWQDNYDLQVYVTMRELKQLCEYLTDSYLK